MARLRLLLVKWSRLVNRLKNTPGHHLGVRTLDRGHRLLLPSVLDSILIAELLAFLLKHGLLLENDP